MCDPVYILIRTSRRKMFFERMMETIQAQTYKNIVTIVHSDDPRDKYVQGDIIIQGAAYGNQYGDAPYNLYNNRLLKAIPDGEGWYHFMDDDDEYVDETVIEQLVDLSLPDHVNVARVVRWNSRIMPDRWGRAKSFQTECFFMHNDHKKIGKWWANKGGDHYYSKQLTKILPVNWIEDLIIAKAQEGKGHGNRLDKGHKINNIVNYKPDEKVPVLALCPHKCGCRKEWLKQGEYKFIPYAQAVELERQGIVKVTFAGERTERLPVKNIFH